MDEQDTITPLQSATVRAALSAIAVNAVTLISVFSGKAFDLDFIKQCVDYGVPMGVNALTMYLGWRAYKGRVNATQIIQKKD